MNDWTQAERRVEEAQRLFEHGQYVKAAEELRSAIAINPYNASWHFNLAIALDAVGAYHQALAAYSRASELEPDDLEILNGMGVDYTRVGKHARSLECFERIEQLDPTYEPAYCNRIITYTEMGDHEQAEVMFYLARQVKEECPLCLYNVANSLYDRGEYHRAVGCWQRCMELDPGHPAVRVRLAEAHWSMGDTDEARRWYLEELRDGRPVPLAPPAIGEHRAEGLRVGGHLGGQVEELPDVLARGGLQAPLHPPDELLQGRRRGRRW